MTIVIEREYDGRRRVRDEADAKLGEVWKHEHPAQGGLPAEVEWQYTEGTNGIVSAPTLRELRRMIEDLVKSGGAHADGGGVGGGHGVAVRAGPGGVPRRRVTEDGR